MRIKLWHCENIDLRDRGGYWQRPLAPRRQTIWVPDLKMASAVMRKWIDENGLGGGNMDTRCGEVHDGRKHVANVSYNGRVWTTEKWPDCKEIKV